MKETIESLTSKLAFAQEIINIVQKKMEDSISESVQHEAKLALANKKISILEDRVNGS